MARPRREKRGLALLALVATIAGGSAPALGNPFYIGRYGGLRSHDPTFDGAFALYWNPAGLARAGWDVALDTTIIARQATFDRDAALNQVPAEEQSFNAGLGRTGSIAAVPSLMGRYGLSRGPVEVGFGAGVFVDIAGSARWDRNERAPAMYPGAIDGPQRWGSISTGLTIISVTAGLAVRHRPTGLSLGIAPILDLVSFTTTRAVNLDGTDDPVDAAGRLKEGRALFAGDEINGRFVLGARWDWRSGSAWPRYGVGLTWLRGGRYDVEGTLKLAVGTTPPSSAAARLTLPVADVLRLGATLGVHRRLVLRPSLEWALWRVLREHQFVAADDGTVLMRFQRDFVDTIAGRVRADVLVHPRVEVSLGLGFERGATPSSTHEPGLGEHHNLEAGAGVVAALSHRVDLTGGVQLQYYLPRTVDDSVQRPTQNGRYTDQRQFVTLHLEVHAWRPYPGERR